MPLPQHKLRYRLQPIAAGLLVCFVINSSSIVCRAAETTGEQVFRDQCARCHGKAGEGTADNYPDPLAGDKSIPQLTKLIQDTMPADQDTKCSADDSAKVAAYIYDAFYSADARVRNKPARVELSRLTVRQYQNAVADVIGSFRQPSEWGSERGLHGEYFRSRSFKPDARKMERVDAEVNFDWEWLSPDPETFDPHNFSVAWEGSVLAPDTGTYEFVVRTRHATRLYVNDSEAPVVDAWVQSGDDTEHRGEVRLLGGRVYPIKLEFSRTKQGVNDQDKSTVKYQSDAETSVSLEWKRPNHTLEVIPARNLSPQKAPVVFVLQTRFPPDDRSIGYERGTAISKAWDEATTDAALETAGYVTDHLEQLAGVNAESAGNELRLRQFCMEFADQAFRRPLSDEQQKFYVQRQFEATTDLATGVKRVVLLVLKSPRFLYREIDGSATDPYDVAARMSFGLWDCAPDRALMKAAAKDKLSTHKQVVAQLNRMLPNLRTQSKLREFFLTWLKISQPKDLAKDPEAFPEFTADVASDLRTSLELSLDEMLASPKADYRHFLLSDAVYLNGRLAKVYGAKLPEDAPFEKVDFEPNHRAGVLSHPYLLANLAYTSASSPIHRGVFLSRSVMGRVLRPPAQSVAPLPPEVHAEMSTRDRVALQTKPEACQGCHAMINPLGFTLENFDAIGRWRESDQNHPIDASGSYLTQSGEVEKFQGMKDLAEFVAASDESQTAFVKQLFHHTVKQPILAYGPNRLRELQQGFAKREFNIQQLLVEIVASSALKGE